MDRRARVVRLAPDRTDRATDGYATAQQLRTEAFPATVLEKDRKEP
jgi:hypothetical protein